jgi:branched-subunit amino acid ABC-type transport system permease component
MDSLPTWAWWLVVAGLLLSPVFAFLIAILVEIFIEVLKEGGLAAVITLVVAALAGRLVLRRFRTRPALKHIVGDQA